MNPDEREWQAQEAAASLERTGGAAHELDSLAASYLAVARAAREPITVKLPEDFARRIANLAAARPLTVEAESRLERRLLLGLAGVFGIAAIAVVMIYGSPWLSTSLGLFSQVGKPSLSLAFSLLGCLGVSALTQHVRRWLVGAARDYA